MTSDLPEKDQPPPSDPASVNPGDPGPPMLHPPQGPLVPDMPSAPPEAPPPRSP